MKEVGLALDINIIFI